MSTVISHYRDCWNVICFWHIYFFLLSFLSGAQQRPILCIFCCVWAGRSRCLHFCFCRSDLSFQASTPYSLESESLRVDCIMSGGASPTLAINAVTNKVGHQWRQHNVGQWQVTLTNPTSPTAGASGALRGRTNNPHEHELKVNETNQRLRFLVICISGMFGC